MATEIYAYLFVSGETVPFDEVTALLGTPPDRTQHNGQRRSPGDGAMRQEDSWQLVTPRRAAYDLDEDVGRLLKRIEGRESALRDLAQKHRLSVGVNCVAYVDGSAPALHFEAALLEKLSARGATLDIDVYAPS